MTSFPSSPSSEGFQCYSSCRCLHSSCQKTWDLPVLQSYRHLLALLLMIRLKITSFSRIPCSRLLTKISLLLSFLTPQITRYGLLCFFGQAWLWFDARLISEVMQMEGIQPVLLHHSTPPLQDMGCVPWIRSGNNFYFQLLFFIIFQWNRSPDVVHSTALQRAGVGNIEEWCGIALGQKRWNWGCLWGHRIRNLSPFCYQPEMSLPSISSK